MLKKPIRLSATPLMARMALIVTPTIVDTGRETLGNMVLKLLAAMNAEKQVGHQAGSGEEKEHHRSQRPHAGDRSGVVVVGWSGSPAQVAGYRKHRDAAGNDRAGNNPGKSAENNIFPVAVVHAEIRARCSRRGEEADGDQQRIQKAGQGFGVRWLVLRNPRPVSPQHDQDHEERNPVQELGDLGDIVDALDRHPSQAVEPDQGDHASKEFSRSGPGLS